MEQNSSKRELRRKLLAEILKQIMSGEFDSYQIPLDKLMQMHTSVRQEYQAPFERDTNNYGYMDTWEMGSGDEPF